MMESHNVLAVNPNHKSLVKDNSFTTSSTMPLLSSTLLATNGNSSTIGSTASPNSQSSLSAKAKHFSIDSLISTKGSPLQINANNYINNVNNDNYSLKSLNNDLISDESNDGSASNHSDLELMLYHSKHKLGANLTDLNDDLKSPSVTPSLDDEDLSSNKTDDICSTNASKDCGQKGKDRQVLKNSGSSQTKPDKNKPELNPACLPRCNCEDLTRIEAKLETKDLWEKFHELGTEMIITKTGRRYDFI